MKPPDAPGEFIEPTPGARRNLVLLFVVMVVAGLLTLEYALPAYLAHVKTLPFCEQVHWIEGALLALSGATMALAPWCLHNGRKLLRLQQYPFPGSMVWQRTRVERGARVRRQGYILVTASIVFLVVPLAGMFMVHGWASEVEAVRCSSGDAEKKKARVSPALHSRETFAAVRIRSFRRHARRDRLPRGNRPCRTWPQGAARLRIPPRRTGAGT